jgi:hypothetical protein
VKSMYRLSGLVAFVALLSFLPSAFGQSRANTRATGATQSVLNSAPTLLAFALTSGHDLYNNNGKGNNGNNGGYGNGGNGGGSCGYGKICAPVPPSPNARVPEGGTALTYLLLAGLCCFGAMVLRSRRQASMPVTN